MNHRPRHALGGLPATILLTALLLTVGACKDETAPKSAESPANSPATEPTAKRQTPDPDPLDVCVVSGEKLGSMSDTIIYNYHGREIRLCCKSCIKKFEADPQKYLAKLDAAAAQASQTKVDLHATDVDQPDHAG